MFASIPIDNCGAVAITALVCIATVAVRFSHILLDDKDDKSSNNSDLILNITGPTAIATVLVILLFAAVEGCKAHNADTIADRIRAEADYHEFRIERFRMSQNKTE